MDDNQALAVNTSFPAYQQKIGQKMYSHAKQCGEKTTFKSIIAHSTHYTIDRYRKIAATKINFDRKQAK